MVFKREGRVYYVSIDERDPSYFRLIFPNFWSIDDEEELTRALRIANEVNSEIKVGFIVVRKMNVWAVAESYMAEDPELGAWFMRTLELVFAATRKFVELMRASDLSMRQN